MISSLDLSERQAARVLEQAVRSRAKLEIEPRPDSHVDPLWGIVAGREQDLLTIELLNARGEAPIRALLGCMCDARTILAGQLYMFETAIVDVSERTAPIRLSLTVPGSIRVANRRRFGRRAPIDAVPVRLLPASAAQPIITALIDLSRTGMGVRVARAGADELLLIGDEVDAEFSLPWSRAVYALTLTVCSKTACQGSDEMSVGLEYNPKDATQNAALELLRAALDSEQERLLDTEAGL